MNILDLQDKLKNFSQDQLVREMQMPTGQMPQFLLLSEITRRQKMKNDYAQQQGREQSTVAQDAINAAGMPQDTAQQLAGTMAPQTDMAGNTGAMPQQMMPEAPQPVQGMAGGGIVALQEGGPVESSPRMFVRNGMIIVVDDEGREIPYGMDPRAEQIATMRDPDAMSRFAIPFDQTPMDARIAEALRPPAPVEAQAPLSTQPALPALTPEQRLAISSMGMANPPGERILGAMPDFRTLGADPFAGRFDQMQSGMGSPLTAAPVGAFGAETSPGAPRSTPQFPDFAGSEVLDRNQVRGIRTLGGGPMVGPVGGPRPTSGAPFSASLSDPRAEQIELMRDPNAMDRFAIPLDQTSEQQRIAEAFRPPAQVPFADRFADRFDQMQGAPAPGSIPDMLPVMTAQPFPIGGQGLEGIVPPPAAVPGVTARPLISDIDLIGSDIVGAPESLLPEPPAPGGTTDPDAPAAAQPGGPGGGGPGGGGPGGGGPGGGGPGGGGGIAGAAAAAGAPSSFEQELINMLAAREKRATQDKWLALAQAGMQLMSSNQPTFGGALGEAGSAGLAALREVAPSAEADRLALLGQLEQSRLARQALAARAAGGGGGGSGGRGRAIPAAALGALASQMEAVAERLNGYPPPTPDEQTRLADQYDALQQQSTMLTNMYISQYLQPNGPPGAVAGGDPEEYTDVTQ
jgi:hypothetical protein